MESDRLAIVAPIRALASGCKVLRLIHRDDHGSNDVQEFAARGISVLSRRHLKCYLYDDDVPVALCVKEGKPEQASGLLQDKKDALAESVGRGNAGDDLKSASGSICIKAKQRLALTGVEMTQSHSRGTRSPLRLPPTWPSMESSAQLFSEDDYLGRLMHHGTRVFQRDLTEDGELSHHKPTVR